MRSSNPVATAAPSRSGWRIVATTRWPRPAIARAAAAPKPRDAPVINTTCWFISRRRWWHIGAVDRVAVLRGADQRAGRAPRRCVTTGVPTDGAVRVAAVDLRRAELVQLLFGFAVTRLLAAVRRRRAFVAVVAVSPEAWKRWRRALLAPVIVAAIGLAFVLL